MGSTRTKERAPHVVPACSLSGTGACRRCVALMNCKHTITILGYPQLDLTASMDYDTALRPTVLLPSVITALRAINGHTCSGGVLFFFYGYGQRCAVAGAIDEQKCRRGRGSLRVRSHALPRIATNQAQPEMCGRLRRIAEFGIVCEKAIQVSFRVQQSAWGFGSFPCPPP